MTNVKKISIEEYRKDIEVGAGALFRFENFALIEGNDAKCLPKYIVIKNTDGTAVKFEEDPATYVFFDLDLEDFHELCSYYLLSLQPGLERAAKTLRDELNRLA